MESYRALLEPAGFRIVKSAGFGSPLLVKLTNLIPAGTEPSGRCLGPSFVYSHLAPSNSRLPGSPGSDLALCSMREDAAALGATWMKVINGFRFQLGLSSGAVGVSR